VRRPPPWQTVPMDDENLLAQAEQALTEIKVNHGLSDRHASVLAALRIRLKGSAGKSLEEMLAAAGDLKPGLEHELAKTESEPKPSLDDLLSPRKPVGE
jgi:DNA mismatch repair protein MutH